MFKNLYKGQPDLKGSQEERRRVLLQKQKEERQNLQDEQRAFSLTRQKDSSTKTNKWQQKQQERIERSFHETYGVELSLQQSEWLRERPEDMCDWLLVPCPRGQRSLVVAHNRQTTVYNKVGRRVCVFRSMLPGDSIDSDALTILDCIYVRPQNAFYVLDVLTFGGPQNLLHCEAEFRFFWLRSKWDEYDQLERRSASNQKPFYLLKRYDFENTISITEAFERHPLWPENKPELDGFLFYNRYASYTCGTTPLVVWLFPFMVPDLLGIPVHEEYKKPIDYEDPLSYMDLFDERLKSKWQRKEQNLERKGKRHSLDEDHPNKMDVSQRNLMHENQSDSDDDDADAVKKVLEAERALEMEEEFEVIDEGQTNNQNGRDIPFLVESF